MVEEQRWDRDGRWSVVLSAELRSWMTHTPPARRPLQKGCGHPSCVLSAAVGRGVSLQPQTNS